MLRIRQSHKDAFRDDAIADFAERLADHLRIFFPDACASLDVSAVDARIRDGIACAARHGIVKERDVAMYIDVLFARGDAFEAEPWAAAVLGDSSIETPTERAEALFDAAFAEVP